MQGDARKEEIDRVQLILAITMIRHLNRTLRIGHVHTRTNYLRVDQCLYLYLKEVTMKELIISHGRQVPATLKEVVFDSSQYYLELTDCL